LSVAGREVDSIVPRGAQNGEPGATDRDPTKGFDWGWGAREKERLEDPRIDRVFTEKGEGKVRENSAASIKLFLPRKEGKGAGRAGAQKEGGFARDSEKPENRSCTTNRKRSGAVDHTQKRGERFCISRLLLLLKWKTKAHSLYNPRT